MQRRRAAPADANMVCRLGPVALPPPQGSGNAVSYKYHCLFARGNAEAAAPAAARRSAFGPVRRRRTTCAGGERSARASTLQEQVGGELPAVADAAERLDRRAPRVDGDFPKWALVIAAMRCASSRSVSLAWAVYQTSGRAGSSSTLMSAS